VVKVGIVGATGYTGVELLRLLSEHREVDICYVASRSEAGKSIREVFPFFKGGSALFEPIDLSRLLTCDVVFFATPHGIAMKSAAALLAAGVKIIDLSADFRLKDANEWQRWYGEVHACAHLLKDAVYGLPEKNREQVKAAQLIANPGCYPTAIQLGWLPLLSTDWIDRKTFIADAKSGVSGAGRVAKLGSLYAEVHENFKAYGIEGHRHLPEIRAQIQERMQVDDVSFVFTPHLVPMMRGILATLYVRTTENFKLTESQLQTYYQDFYQGSAFVEVLPVGKYPETRNVRGTNLCQLGIRYLPDEGMILIVSAIDNLIKGAAGQAVQNMNIIFDLEESSGLNLSAWAP
jgi:N-acetyl-gamma-glutamyl-phosphate reductase